MQEHHDSPNGNSYADMSGDYRELGSVEQIAALYGALALAQEEFTEIRRTKTVTVRMKEGGSYSFAYAPLEDLLAATRPALAKHRLAVLTPIVRPSGLSGDAKVVIVLAHADGGRIVSTFAFPPKADIKDLAGQVTYLRRYSYSALLNLAADDDDDDNGNRPVSQERQPVVSNHQAPNRASQPVRSGAGASPARANGNPAAQTESDLGPMVESVADPDYAWSERVRAAAEEVGIRTSAIRLPARRHSLLNTTNSLLTAVNTARSGKGLAPITHDDDGQPAARAVGSLADGSEEDEAAPTTDQLAEYEEIIERTRLEHLIVPETGETLEFDSIDPMILSVREMDRILVLLREYEERAGAPAEPVA